MNYYRKNKKILLQKAHDKYHYRGGKEKAGKCYQDNKEKLRKTK